MKEKIGLVFLVVLWVTVIEAQEKIHISEIEERNVNGKTVIFANDAQYEGVVYENYVRPKLKYSVKAGIKDGPYELYYENGQLKRKTTFSDDKYNGLYEEYY